VGGGANYQEYLQTTQQGRIFFRSVLPLLGSLQMLNFASPFLLCCG
jgi:hypothetical protein